MEESLFQDLRRKISLYLDHEMSPTDQTEFMKEIKKDPARQIVLQKEMAIRDKIRQKLVRPAVPDNFVQRIKNKINRYPGS